MSSSKNVYSHRYWIGRLYETLFPPSFYLGNVANLDMATLQDANGFKIAKTWSLNILYSLSHHRYDPKFLTIICQCAKFCFFLDKQAARIYISNAPIVSPFNALSDFWRKNGEESICIVPEILDSLLGMEYPSIPRGVLFVK